LILWTHTAQVSHNPALLSVSFALSKSRPKDTRENILATKEFTVNIISEPFVEAANATSIEAPADIDEWVVSGLTPEPSVSTSGIMATPLVTVMSLECCQAPFG
jgi:flavin reductase (DIM6/NTAB) family NADH-FMN oxidoreductase RutF